MSLLNIPDIPLDMNISLEDAVSLLLTSIAIEEISLSRLIDAETDRVLATLNTCKNNDSVVSDVVKINNSVNNTLKNITEQQKILQVKLENVKEILSNMKPHSDMIENKEETKFKRTTNTISNTNTYKKPLKYKIKSANLNSSIIEKPRCSYSLIGTGNGCVSNNSDEFYCQIAVVYIFALCHDIYNRTICYSVQNYTDNICMYASGHNVKIEYPTDCLNKVIIYGTGQAEKSSKCNTETSGPVNFNLTVSCKEDGELEFKMEIKSDTEDKLNHDSGFIKVKNESSDLRFELCC